MVRNACERAEILAGAIALGEASDGEREEYRRHLAACSSCIASIGGEREIERVIATVALARDTETWEPVIAPPWHVEARSRHRAWRMGTMAVGIALVASVGVHAILAYGLNAVKPTPVNPIVIDYDGQHITLERRAPIVKRTVVAKTQDLPHPNAVRDGARKSEVTVQYKRAVVAEVPAIDRAATSNIPIWRRNPAGAARADAAASAQVPLAFEHRAESMAVAVPPTIREVEPVGGDAAIDPVPPMIAYAEGANGTTAFEVTVDEHGVPTRCTITKASGYLVLDHAVCKAAMKARFLPRAINGHGVPSVYRDAFTFRSNGEE
ncbi:MAG: TonB family protein [Vulcanimicrobiaceae bacterium]